MQCAVLSIDRELSDEVADKLEQRVTLLENKSRDNLRLAKIVSGILALILVPYFGWLGISVYDLNGRVSGIEGEVKNLPAKLAQQLLQQSQQAAAAGKTADAARALQIASIFIDQARKDRSPVDSAYFAQVYQQINALMSLPQLSEGIHNIRLQVASYRSALQIAPKGPEKIQEVTNPVPFSVQSGTTLEKSVPGQFFLSAPGVTESGVANIRLRGTVSGVTQILDNLTWTNVAFENVHIIYNGGPTELRNVLFVNCTFEFPEDQRGAQLADYLILGKPSVTIS